MTGQNSNEALRALIVGIPCRCLSVAQLGERDPGCNRCQAIALLASHAPPEPEKGQ